MQRFIRCSRPLLLALLLLAVPCLSAQEPVIDWTEYTYSAGAGGIGSFANYPVTRTFDQEIASLRLFIIAGQADDIGYVGSKLVTTVSGVCGPLGTVTSRQEVTDQVTVSGNTASFVLRAQENCCCVTGWGSATQSDRTDARFEWQVTFTSGKVAAISATEPVIPSGATTVNRCVLYRSDLTGVVTEAGEPQAGIALRFASDRGTPPDTFVQPSAPTDASGTARGQISTRRQGVANISDDTPDVDTPAPAAITFQEADWESRFHITGYILADENDYSGPMVTNPCGLQGTWKQNFLYGRGVLMQGSGRDAAGRLVTIDWAASGRPLNRNNVCFRFIDCPMTASGACAEAGTTIAVDPAVIPMGASVDIERVGVRVAQDTGGAINNYDIDVFRGFGLESMRGFGTFNGSARYLSGGGPCN